MEIFQSIKTRTFANINNIAARTMIGKNIEIHLYFYFVRKTGVDKIDSDSYSKQTNRLKNEHEILYLLSL